MAQAKKSRGTRKKRTTKTRFYVVKTVQETRSRITDKLEDYSQTYITRPIKSGKGMVTDLKVAPRKTLSTWLDDGKETITDLNKETRSTVGGMIKDGKAFLTKAGKEPRQTLNGVFDDGKTRIEDLREDTRSRIADLKADTRSLLRGSARMHGWWWMRSFPAAGRRWTKFPANKRSRKRSAAESGRFRPSSTCPARRISMVWPGVSTASTKRSKNSIRKSLPDKGIPCNPKLQKRIKESTMQLIKTYANGRFYDTLNKNILARSNWLPCSIKKKRSRLSCTKPATM
jgi:hypothetical protein